MGVLDDSSSDDDESRKKPRLSLLSFTTEDDTEPLDKTLPDINGETAHEDDPLDAYMKSLDSNAIDTLAHTVDPRSDDRLDYCNDDEATAHWEVLDNDATTNLPAAPCFIKPTAALEIIQKIFWTPTDTNAGREWRKENSSLCNPPCDPITNFAELGSVLPVSVLHQIQQSYNTPTLVQAQTLPVLFSGRNALVAAQTGQGKTFAYVWPMIAHVSSYNDHLQQQQQALVLVPTRELAIQVQQQAQLYLKLVHCESIAIVGGSGRYILLQELRRQHYRVVIATPGRLLDVVGSNSKYVDLSQFTYVVLDESDKMLHMGFQQQVQTILKYLPPNAQKVLLSATMGKRVEHVAKEWLGHDYTRISVGRTGESSKSVQQHCLVLPTFQAKKQFLVDMLPSFQVIGRTLVFCSTREGCEELSLFVKERVPSIPLVTLHGDKHQSDRNAALKAFKKGSVSVMIATDVAGRGIDVPQVATVVNFDPAKDLDSHTHRCGRAGRLHDGEQQLGSAYTLLTPKNAEFARVLMNSFEREGRPISNELAQLARGSKRQWDGGDVPQAEIGYK
jgi:ATP-dependent RNA helicase DDX42